MALINPHINFNGNAEEAFTFTNIAEKCKRRTTTDSLAVMLR